MGSRVYSQASLSKMCNAISQNELIEIILIQPPLKALSPLAYRHPRTVYSSMVIPSYMHVRVMLYPITHLHRTVHTRIIQSSIYHAENTSE